MRFTHPAGLLLLLLLPLAAAIGWPARGRDRRREMLSLGLRLLILLALVLSLAGLETGRAANRLAMVFLIDASDSMPVQAANAAEDYVRQSLAGMGADDQAAIVVFGGDALVERPMSPARQLGPLTSVPNRGQTDLSAAVRLGLALYPSGTARRMVILSDGKVTGGDTQQAAKLADASGVQIQVVPFSADPGAESLIAAVELPQQLSERERFDLNITTQATQETPAVIRVFANDQALIEARQTIPRGEHSFSLPLTAGGPGFYHYQVQIEPEQDVFYQNNVLAAYSFVEGPPKMLVISPAGTGPTASDPDSGTSSPAPAEEGANLIAALKSAGLEVETTGPAGLPAEIGELNAYKGLVMVNVSARDLSQRQMSAVQSYVRDLGGGLVAVGGPNSFGVGGYYRTPLEETLPVEMQIKDEQRRPSVTIVFIIDRSGSMSDASGGAAKLELAKEAAIRSIDLMFPQDRVGVIAFDETASWVVPITELSDPDVVKNAIGSIRSAGGTDILAGLQAMAADLPSDPSAVKHVILLTDGGADPTGIPELVERLHEQNAITLSAVGVGQDAAPFLPGLAELGGGRYHFAGDPGAIPSIFTEETSLATRAYIEEHPFTPRQASASPILSGIDAVPQLFGYIGTTAKDAAQTVLVSDLGDPVLAIWQYGLGRAAAFTSDATGRWGKDWVRWELFPNFWSQVLNSVIQEGAQRRSLDIRVEPSTSGDQAAIVVDAAGEDRAYLNGYSMTARILSPDGQAQSLSLEQIAPGRYQANFEPDSDGAYWIAVSGAPPDSTEAASSLAGEVAASTGWVRSYSLEYRMNASDPALLQKVASVTGGGIASADPKAVFRHDLSNPRATQPAWPWLLGLAALLLPIDIGVRRLVFTGADIRRAVSKFPVFAGERGRAGPSSMSRSQGMEALLQAKRRASPGIRDVKDTQGRDERSPTGGAAKEDGVNSPDPGMTSNLADDKTKSNQAGTAASLLASKRQRQKK